MTYEKYEEQAEEERQENKKLIRLFRKWLLDSRLKEKTINKHTGNVDFYINEYLLYEEAIPATKGITSIDGFFSWFFPRKAMWSSVASTKETVASLKKFYKCLAENELIELDDYQMLLEDIKENMDDWLEHYGYQVDW